ncbi:hypothetical protein [Sinosporangium siamense]|nr:hypothetical protein [Sinosporangium siamense]
MIRIPEPASSVRGETRVTQVTTYPLVYADGESHNVEALAIHPRTGQAIAIEKTEKQASPAPVWIAPTSLSTSQDNVLRKVIDNVPVPGASGAGFSPTGDRLVVRNATHAYVWWIRNNDVVASLRGTPVTIQLPEQRQGEGVTFSPHGDALLVNSEGPRQPVWKVPLPEDADVDDAVPAGISPSLAEGTQPVNDNDTLMIVIAAGAGGSGLMLLTYRVIRARRTSLSLMSRSDR